MERETLRALAAQALTAMKAGNQIVAKSVGDIQDVVQDQGLGASLDKGAKLREVWASRIDVALHAVGGTEGEMINPVISGLQEVGAKIRRQAPDDVSRDLGICANGQMSLHYWIAAFGTVRAYLHQLDLQEAAGAMRDSLDEAKQADEEHNRIAERILAA